MKRNKLKKQNLWLSLVIFLVSALALSLFFLQKTTQKRNIKYLEKQVEYQAKNFPGNFAVSIFSFGFNKINFNYNSDEKIAAASIIKIPILAAALAAVYEEKIKLSDRIVINQRDLTGGAGILKRVDLPLEMTFEALLVYMVAISDNIATNKVIDLLGFEYINQVFRDIGLKDTILRRKMMDFQARRQGIENFTTSYDIALLLKNIYLNRLYGPKISEKARNILFLQQHSDRIPLLLPDSVRVGHKTGLERGVVHDAGIIYGQKRDFVIAVLTRNVSNYSQAKKFIADVAALAYNHFNN